MAVIAQGSQSKSNVVKWTAHEGQNFHEDKVVINDAAATIKAGTVLGKVTATGKYKVCKQAATDGSQNAAAVLTGNLLGEFVDVTVPLNTDTRALALTRGPAILANSTVAGVGLVWDASFTTQAQKDAAIAAGSLNTNLVIVAEQV